MDDGAADNELVRAALGDPDAFATLYRRHVDAVYRFCSRRLGDRQAAEDATSQVFLRALRALPAFRGGSFRAWLFAIAHRIVLEAWQRRRPMAALDDMAEAIDPAPLPDELAERAENVGEVRALLACLPPAERQVIDLRLAGLTGAEIAEALGKSRGAVDVAAHRAVVRLRAAMTAGRTPAEVGHGRDERA